MRGAQGAWAANVTPRVLRVEAPHFVAGAVWEKRPEGWRCSTAAPILAWMIGMDPQSVQVYLARKRWPHAWTDPQQERNETHELRHEAAVLELPVPGR